MGVPVLEEQPRAGAAWVPAGWRFTITEGVDGTPWWGENWRWRDWLRPRSEKRKEKKRKWQWVAWQPEASCFNLRELGMSFLKALYWSNATSKLSSRKEMAPYVQQAKLNGLFCPIHPQRPWVVSGTEASSMAGESIPGVYICQLKNSKTSGVLLNA